MVPRSHAITDAERARIERVDRLVAADGRGVRELIGMLSDPSWTVRRAVVSALASLGDEAVRPLCTWLREDRTNENAIAAAVDALASSIGSSVTDEVLQLAADDQPQVVADAAQILGRRRVPESVSTLARLVQHENDNISVAAVEALGMIGGTAAVEVLIRVVERRQFFRTFPAVQVLSRTGDPRSVPPLVALLDDETYRFEVVRALGRTGMATAIAPIVSVLRNPSDAITRLVAMSLSELIERAEWAGTIAQVSAALRDALASSLGRFASALRGADPDERSAIARVLGRAGDISILPAITAMLDDAETASAATDALHHLGSTSDDVLVATLASNHERARRATLLPLVRTMAAAPVVRALVHDDDPEVRARACEALARIGDVASVPLLFEALGDPSVRVAHAAVSSILALGSSETEELALAAARSPRPAVRRHAIRLLGSFGFASAFGPLCAAIDDADRRIAELAITALGTVDDPRVDDVLATVNTSSDDALRSAVMRAAAHRGGPIAIRMLVRGVTDTSPWVRYYAVQGLGRLGTHEVPQASALLIQRLRDPAPQVRVAAIEALSRLGSPDAWDAVCRAASSPDPDERRAGLVGVGMQARPGAVEILIDGARSFDPATRLVAVSGLARLDDPRALDALDAAVGDPAAEVRDATLSLLADREDEPAARVLVERALETDSDPSVQRALSRPGAARISAIVLRLADADSRNAPILVAALARMHTDEAKSALFEALRAANPAARAAAANALVAIDAEGALEEVAILAKTDRDPEVRRVCSAALGMT